MGASSGCCRAGGSRDAALEASKSTQATKKFHVGDFASSRGDPGLPKMKEQHLSEDERKAGNRVHTCTDVFCLIIFVVSLGCTGVVQAYAQKNGDIRKLYHGIDFQGQVCGVDHEVKDKKLLYWCPTSGGTLDHSKLAALTGDAKLAKAASVYNSLNHLDTRHPICVSECPEETDATSCYTGVQKDVGEKEDAAGSFTETIKYMYKFVQSYPNTEVGGRLCVPASAEMAAEVTGSSGLDVSGIMEAMGEVYASWTAVAGSALLAIVIGYVYLFLVQYTMEPIIYTTLALSAILPLTAGLCCLYGAYKDESDKYLKQVGADGVDIPVFPSTGNVTYDLIIGGVLCGIGLLVCIVGCCCRHSIDLVIGTLKATCECLRDLPSLLLQPVLSIAAKAAVIGTMGYTFALLATCGEVEPYEVADGLPTGLTRSFTWTEREQQYLAFYGFMLIWVLELIHCLDQFCVAYAAQLWFFKDYVKIGPGLDKKPMTCFPLVRGFLVGVIFHLGTLAFGAFLLAALKVIYFILALVMREVEKSTSDSEGKTNCLVKAIIGTCCCCVTIWDAIIRFMTSKTFIVTAIESEPFCTAASRSFTVVASEVTSIGLLEGATWVLSIGGVITITGVGSYLTWFLVHTLPQFNDTKSEYFVKDPEAVTAAAGVCSFFIAVSFMVVFDMISDTIIFCWALDRQRHAEDGLFSSGGGNYIPYKLRSLLASTGDNNSDHTNGSRTTLLGGKK